MFYVVQKGEVQYRREGANSSTEAAAMDALGTSPHYDIENISVGGVFGEMSIMSGEPRRCDMIEYAATFQCIHFSAFQCFTVYANGP